MPKGTVNDQNAKPYNSPMRRYDPHGIPGEKEGDVPNGNQNGKKEHRILEVLYERSAFIHQWFLLSTYKCLTFQSNYTILSTERMLPVQLLHRIFESISPKEYKEMEAVLQIRQKEIPKGGVLLRQSDRRRFVFLLLKGSAHAVRYAPDGRETDYTQLSQGDLLSEASDFIRSDRQENTVFADTPCTVLYFSYEALKRADHPTAQKILWALYDSFAAQYAQIQQRVTYLTCSSLREKLLRYLNDHGAEGEWFEIPLSRSAMASYLFCDRTALCRELSKLKSEGFLEYRKNKFRILPPGIAKSD